MPMRRWRVDVQVREIALAAKTLTYYCAGIVGWAFEWLPCHCHSAAALPECAEKSNKSWHHHH